MSGRVTNFFFYLKEKQKKKKRSTWNFLRRPKQKIYTLGVERVGSLFEIIEKYIDNTFQRSRIYGNFVLFDVAATMIHRQLCTNT